MFVGKILTQLLSLGRAKKHQIWPVKKRSIYSHKSAKVLWLREEQFRGLELVKKSVFQAFLWVIRYFMFDIVSNEKNLFGFTC